MHNLSTLASRSLVGNQMWLFIHSWESHQRPRAQPICHWKLYSVYVSLHCQCPMLISGIRKLCDHTYDRHAYRLRYI